MRKPSPPPRIEAAISRSIVHMACILSLVHKTGRRLPSSLFYPLHRPHTRSSGAGYYRIPVSRNDHAACNKPLVPSVASSSASVLLCARLPSLLSCSFLSCIIGCHIRDEYLQGKSDDLLILLAFWIVCQPRILDICHCFLDMPFPHNATNLKN